MIEEPRRLFFFCVMIRRELWESLGGLDEIYQLGTYEDDDFCLRARMAGWSMAVNPGVFVFNHVSKTFEENQIDHDEWLFRNEKVFLERASVLSRSFSPGTRQKKAVPSTSVIVAVGADAAGRLADSLASLANQTVTGFETVVVSRHEQELPSLPAELVLNLRIRRVTVPGNPQDADGFFMERGGCGGARRVSCILTGGRYLFSLSPRDPASSARSEQVPGSVHRLEHRDPLINQGAARGGWGI